MKQHLAAIAYNEKELEAYVSQMKSFHFEPASDVKKADDGTYYQVMARTVKEAASVPKAAPVEAVAEQA